MLAGVSASVVSPGLPTVNSSAGRRVVTAVPAKDRAAPAQPSGQDQRVAAQANALEIKAQSELTQKSRAKLFGRQGNDARPNNLGITNLGTRKSANYPAAAFATLTAYNAGTSTTNNNGTAGNILNIIG